VALTAATVALGFLAVRGLPGSAGEAALPWSPPASNLALDFEHSLRQGHLRVWVDGRDVYDDDFTGRVSKRVASIRLHKGSVDETLPVPAGSHEVKVEVSWDGNVRSATITRVFEAGRTHRLSARLGTGLGGLVKKELDLSWQ
jgi:hypothetical protein